MNTGPSGYEGDHPPVLNRTEDEPPCPYCHLDPCIISRAPNWLVGSSAPGLGSLAKRYTPLLEISASPSSVGSVEPPLIFK